MERVDEVALVGLRMAVDVAAATVRELGFRVMDRHHYRERWRDGQELRTVVDRARSTASCQFAR